MKTTFARGSAFAALCFCLAAFTGTALADNGNGNDGNGNGNAAAGNPATPPGQEKKADQSTTTTQAPPVAEQPAPASVAAVTPHGNPNAPGQEKKAAAATSSATSQGQEKQAAKADVSTPGVKPSNTTSHWTHCTTGGTTANTTCAGNGPKADGSKQYGNGTTAAQIAVSRGGVNVVLTGPGNSQPHKVAVCPKKTNKSGGVDVHAVKSYSSASCAPAATGGQSVPQRPAAVQPATQQAITQQASVPAPESLGVAPQTASGTTPTAATGGVLGAETTVQTPAAKSSHAPGGVLGVTAKLGRVASAGTLPFTGLPLWTAVLAAFVLIATGLALRTGRPAASL
jgi:hypothetical protein